MTKKIYSKRILSLVLSALMILTVMPFGVFADTCTHQDCKSIDPNEPTCTDAGNMRYKQCLACNVYLNEDGVEISKEDAVIPALGHDFAVESYGENVTCSITGEIKMKCTRCDAAETVFGTKEHVFTAVEEVPADCENSGVKAHQECETCENLFDMDGNLIFDEDLSIPASHVLGEKTEAAESTCTEKGNVEYYACVNCDKKLDKDLNVIENVEIDIDSAKHGELTHHDAIPATCKDEGTKEYWSCADCKKNFADEKGLNELDSIVAEKTNEHTWSETPKVIDGTETHNYTCTICGAKSEAVPCDFETKVVDEPSCLKEGKAEKTCKDCGNTVNAVIEKKAHSFLFSTDQQDATCTEDGMRAVSYCRSCKKYVDGEGKIYDEPDDEALIISASHKYKTVEAKAATCTENGNIKYQECEVCGKIFDMQGTEIQATVLLALGHKQGDFVPAKDATCTEDGNKEYYSCKNGCGSMLDAKGEVIPSEDVIIKAAHTVKDKVSAKASTCVSEGNIEYYTCANCSETLDKDGKVIDVKLPVDPKNHASALTKNEAVKAVCGENGHDGMKEYWECKDCKVKFSDEKGTNAVSDAELVINKEDQHTWGTAAENVANTETHTYTCTLCGEKSEAQNCKFEMKSVTLEATCKNEGKALTQCDCGKTKEVSIPVDSSAHSIKAVAEVKADCNNSGVKAHYECELCGKLFSDKDGKTEVTKADLTTPKTEDHVYTDKYQALTERDKHVKVCDVCGKPGAVEDCNYVVDIASSVNPTCTSTGVTVEKCLCGRSKNIPVPIDENAHSLINFEKLEATCGDDGHEAYVQCEYCDKLFDLKLNAIDKITTIPATGKHEYKYEFDYTLGVNHRWSCDKCQESGIEKHKNTKVVELYQEGTCEAPMIAEIKCDDCGAEIFVTDDENYGHHILVHHEKVAPVCGKDGKDGNAEYWECTGYCKKKFADKDAKKEFEGDVVIKKSDAHKFGAAEVVPAKCGEAGTSTVTCELCGEKTVTTLPALEHNWKLDSAVGTCTDKIVKQIYRCSLCGNMKSEEVEGNKAHTYTAEAVVIDLPDCTRGGKKAIICTVCKAEKEGSAQAIPALGHTDVKETGNNEGKCLVCGTQVCDCSCHTATGWRRILFNILLFFQKIIGTNKVCLCGKAH